VPVAPTRVFINHSTAEWTEEDSRLADEEADRLHTALGHSRGLGFRYGALD
jgi:hypothetical protein